MGGEWFIWAGAVGVLLALAVFGVALLLTGGRGRL